MAGDDELLRGLGVTARGERELARDVIRDAAGKIVSVEVSYPDDFTGQMLRYSEQFSFLPDVN